MRKQNKIMFALKGWRGLLIVVVAALLVELLSALQYYYTHRLMEDEMERRAEMELTMKALIMKGIIENSERTFKSHIMEVKNNLSNPDSLSSIMAWILKYSPHLKGCGIAFNPRVGVEVPLYFDHVDGADFRAADVFLDFAVQHAFPHETAVSGGHQIDGLDGGVQVVFPREDEQNDQRGSRCNP